MIRTLRKMGNIILTDEAGDTFEANFDKDLWVKLASDIENVLSGDYKGQDTQVFQAFRRGRSSSDIRKASHSLLITVQNRLSSLCNTIASTLEERLKNEDTHSSSNLINKMGKCLDIEEMLEMGTDDMDFNEKGIECLEELLTIAKYNDDEVKEIKDQYVLFKERLHGLSHDGNDAHDLVNMYEHLLYKVHRCTDECISKYQKTCSYAGKLITP